MPTDENVNPNNSGNNNLNDQNQVDPNKGSGEPNKGKIEDEKAFNDRLNAELEKQTVKLKEELKKQMLEEEEEKKLSEAEKFEKAKAKFEQEKEEFQQKMNAEKKAFNVEKLKGIYTIAGFSDGLVNKLVENVSLDSKAETDKANAIVKEIKALIDKQTEEFKKNIQGGQPSPQTGGGAEQTHTPTNKEKREMRKAKEDSFFK